MLLASLACLAGFAMLFVELDIAAISTSLASLQRIWFWLFALELARLGCEVLTTRSLLGMAGGRLPMLRLLRGQFLGQACDVILPLGRTSAETAKAVLYASHIGAPIAGAVATTMQLAVLATNCTWVVTSFLPSRDLGVPGAASAGLVTYMAATFSIVLAVVLFAAAPWARRASQRFPLLHASLERLGQLLLATPLALPLAMSSQLLGRLVQATQLALIVATLGAPITPAHVLTLEAVYIVGAALGEFVPAQLGAADAALVVVAPALGLTAVAAFSTTLAMRAVQLIVAGTAALTSLGLWWMEERNGLAREALRPEAAQLLPSD
jgi:hypothetical protein